jgi:uncharacterized membrane protein YphA (DoxX/SURF4 family)
MNIAAISLSVILALACLGAGTPKALLKGDVPTQLHQHMNLSFGLIRFIGLAEVAAAAGLIIGIWWRPLGIAAAIGMAVLLISASGFHAKAGDYADPKQRGGAIAPVVLALIAIGAAVTLSLTL